MLRAFSGKIHRPFLAQVVPPFSTRGLWWRHLAVQVGTTTDQGLHNKPSAAVHPGALAAGILPQYNSPQSKESQYNKIYDKEFTTLRVDHQLRRQA